MIKLIEETYKEYKYNNYVITDHDEILLYYPDYYKKKIELEKMANDWKKELFQNGENYFLQNYKNSHLYQKLVKKGYPPDSIYNIMSNNKKSKEIIIQTFFDDEVKKCLNLCELIDYIGHYPTTFPVPYNKEKNPKMEELIKKYFIYIEYYLSSHSNKPQIHGHDIYRIIEALLTNLQRLEDFRNNSCFTEKWLTEYTSNEVIKKISAKWKKDMIYFPGCDFDYDRKFYQKQYQHYLKEQQKKC